MGSSSNHLEPLELINQLNEAHEKLEIGATYQHYRDPNSRYTVLGLCMVEALQEPGVLYKCESGSDTLKLIVWVRPLRSWMEKVEVEGKAISRFQKVG